MESIVSKATNSKITLEQFINWLQESNEQGKLYIRSGVLHCSATPAQHQVLKFISASTLKPMLLDRFVLDIPTAFIIAGKISAEFGGIPARTPATKPTAHASAPTPVTPTPKDIIECISRALLQLDIAGNSRLTKVEILSKIKEAKSLLQHARG